MMENTAANNLVRSLRTRKLLEDVNPAPPREPRGRKLTLVLAAVIFAVGFTAPMVLWPGPTGATVFGRVMDLEGRPVSGARVAVLVQAEQDGESQETTTDHRGQFVLKGVQPGSYRFVAEVPSAGGVAIPFSCSAGDEIDAETVRIYRP